MKRIILFVIFTASILAGCGGNDKPIAYRPIAYGENNQCYYVNNPAEVHILQAQGLCQRGWAPTLMPMYWHQRYYPYYSSPAYYNVYVPADNRSSYTASERAWGSTNKTAIATESKKATYQGSNGKTVPASKIGAAKYGGGARFGPPGTKFGGGSGRTQQNPATPTVNTPSAPSKNPSAPSVKTPSSPSKPPSVKSSPPKSTPSGGSKGYGGGSGRSSGGGGSKGYGGGGGRR